MNAMADKMADKMAGQVGGQAKERNLLDPS